MKPNTSNTSDKFMRRSNVLLIACGIFVVFILIAILTYKGGNLIDPLSKHYNLVRNYLSDLGITETLMGNRNLLGSIFFIIGTSILGLGMLDFASNWRALNADKAKTNLIGPASTVLLAAAGISLVCVAITPWNIYFREHVMIFKLFLGLIFGWSVCYSYLLIISKQTKLQIITSCAAAILTGIYIGIITFGPIYGGADRLVFQTVFEKFVVLIIVANLAYQAYAIRNRR